ncbi:methyltransferase domain-containing protein [Acetobacterium tundrae]|uniref:Methyltransferase domain-containing protein n=1 Tax=Acetobacterium tundrae TaxID=132932 RepID=A0ABR6WN35_9FIRM|nr:methyltransferase domain-containing protein [Acetobacterium tundrae]
MSPSLWAKWQKLNRDWRINKLSGNCAYESPAMACLLGATLRPGGFDLTQKGIEFCQWTEADSLLDLGCGQGATVGYLDKNHGLKAVGIDPSKMLLKIAQENNPDGEFYIGRGEALPFENASFQGVLSECTLSLMDNVKLTLQEVHRVLKKDGYFFITDVYARNPEFLDLLAPYEFESCMRGLYDIRKLEINVESNGFEVMLLEDHSDLMKQLLVKTIFENGSMKAFWKKTTGSCASDFQEQLKRCKPGYFMMIARKVE